MNKVCIFCLLWLGLLHTGLSAQEHCQQQRVMFWNVENAFWPEDDPEHDDDEFTPNGERRWTLGRLRQKLLQLTRVIVAAGEGRVPMLVGLAEVEGDSVMHYWTHHTPLWDEHYEYVVSHGPDQRGIQTALLYQPTDFHLITAEEHQVMIPRGRRATRNVLHAAGRLVSGDTLDVLVCHLPSRMGGARQTRPSRDAAHRTVMHVADSLVAERQRPQVIIMGDMNDYPSKRHCWWGDGFQNLMLPLQQTLRYHPTMMASHKYQGEWGYLDQMIVNRGFEHLSEARICVFPFMLINETVRLGHRPARSFYGYQYEGGYSDHLPILLDMEVYF